MDAKKTSKKPVNKSKFVRSLPRAMPGADVVKKAKAAGITLSEKYVSTIRYNAKVSRKTKAAKSNGASAVAVAPAKRGPGRPPKSASMANGNGSVGVGNRTAGGLEAAIEAIVERKVTELLKQRLGALFG